jgi:hypothetical protein
MEATHSTHDNRSSTRIRKGQKVPGKAEGETVYLKISIFYCPNLVKRREKREEIWHYNAH